MSEPANKDTHQLQSPRKKDRIVSYTLYRVAFRENGQVHSAYSKVANLSVGDIAMIQSDHGLEPARIFRSGIKLPDGYFAKDPHGYMLVRRATNDECVKFDNLLIREDEAFKLCATRITEVSLKMKLISVERYFNGSKVVFYFTAENRVDFRELVKGLVQDFRTRVEMKQIGVRHETKMIGGLGCCGRELCCSSFIGEFAPVSIKMAKDQDLPLNPAKISGICNRLLCCLTHENETYKALRKGMPKYGKNLLLDGKTYKIIKINVLAGTINVVCPGVDGVTTLLREEWEKGVVENRPKQDGDRQKKPTQGPRGKKNRESESRSPKLQNKQQNKQQNQKPTPAKNNPKRKKR